MKTENLRLRPVTPDDIERIFAWRNDPFILQKSSSLRGVTWTEHREWFEASLGSTKRRIFIVMVNEEAVGQVRFDRTCEEGCVISAYLIERWTARGLGVRAIAQGCEMIFLEWPIRKITAYVRAENAASASAFCKAGFVEQADGEAHPSEHRGFIMTRPQR